MDFWEADPYPPEYSTPLKQPTHQETGFYNYFKNINNNGGKYKLTQGYGNPSCIRVVRRFSGKAVELANY